MSSHVTRYRGQRSKQDEAGPPWARRGRPPTTLFVAYICRGPAAGFSGVTMSRFGIPYRDHTRFGLLLYVIYGRDQRSEMVKKWDERRRWGQGSKRKVGILPCHQTLHFCISANITDASRWPPKSHSQNQALTRTWKLALLLFSTTAVVPVPVRWKNMST